MPRAWFLFAPRIRDLKDNKLYLPGDPINYQTFGDNVKQEIILTQWDEILRLTTSLALPLRENEHTIFAFDWLLDPKLRQRVTAGLNKSEANNTFARAVCWNRRGEFQDRTYE